MPVRCTEPLGLAIFLAGCTGGGREGCTGQRCYATDANNFSYTSTLDVDTQVEQALADVLVDWSAMTTDMRGQAFDPTQVGEARLIVAGNLDRDQVIQRLVQDDLAQEDLSLYALCQPDGETSCPLSRFHFVGSNRDVQPYFDVGTGTWLVALFTDGVQGARSLLFLEPDDRTNQTVATFTDTTATLQVSADLHDLTPLVVSSADVRIDWSQITTDGLGNPLSLHKLDTVAVAHYDLTPSELEERFLELDQLATATWSLELAGQTAARLSGLEGDTPFPGVDDSGTWLFALRCSTCDNPVPKFITVLQPG